ncbi:MAG: DUF1699 family protein [Methanothrix sp.]|jgi:hypothetical protein|uniref:DUF1699 family protein n=1 Tax=Methanothrix thermoacetophila (strain DSM 6194 / JCM 14653 / NBRC 101360 / PT) TaxID=349307 RepID=A0B568_METTP|nr:MULTISPECIES: DUF1699 family protein [Methanothrix]ABK13842.1 conserved hypothetical protein [Methanothrix thermoacetophila PT]MBC7079983.1 DUF1699 family protein [Methanothrix sp.]MCX8206767.1 DUF1699 family protein [Methanothrix sp.]MDI9616288.1 DUF1699 family protein [Methanothrix sp.]NPU88132.1 DUF1699 family protein [Methanothrix sp.]
MRLRVVSSKKEISDLNRNEQVVHLAFRASNMDVMNLVRTCPRLKAVQIPPSYYQTMSKAAQQFLELQGIEIIKGDVWGHRKDIDEYYSVSEKVIDRIASLMAEGYSIDETVKKVHRETKLSEDLIRYLLKEQVMA